MKSDVSQTNNFPLLMVTRCQPRVRDGDTEAMYQIQKIISMQQIDIKKHIQLKIIYVKHLSDNCHGGQDISCFLSPPPPPPPPPDQRDKKTTVVLRQPDTISSSVAAKMTNHDVEIEKEASHTLGQQRPMMVYNNSINSSSMAIFNQSC